MSFEHITGNDAIKSLLEHTVDTGAISHSYMFIGPDGIGKFLFAKEFACMVLCQGNDKKPCLNCHSCTLFESENHPDFMCISPEDGKAIKIEQIRLLQEKIAEKPIVSNKKIYIINDSDCMTKEAQNCLLKTLEEPPSYAVLILVLSNESNLLNTIKSRCTKIVFHSLQDSEILQYFKENNLDFSDTPSILKLCGGSIGKALSLKDDVPYYENINEIITSLASSDIIDIWNKGEFLYKAKDNIANMLEYINIALMKQYFKSKDVTYTSCVSIVEQTKNRLNSNANYDMCIDNLLLKMWEEFHEKYCWS